MDLSFRLDADADGGLQVLFERERARKGQPFQVHGPIRSIVLRRQD